MGGVNDDDEPPKKRRPADNGANVGSGDFGDAMTYNSGSADYGGAASDDRSTLAVMHGWLRSSEYTPAKQMMAKMLGLQPNAAIHSAARTIPVEWAFSGELLKRKFELPDFDTEQQANPVYLCSYVRDIQSRLLRCIPADLANESDAPENVALFLGHGGASVSSKEMIYSNTLDQQTMDTIVELATRYNQTLVFTRSVWLAEVKQEVEKCLPNHTFDNQVLSVTELACGRPGENWISDIPLEVNMYRDVNNFVVNGTGTVYLPDLSVMDPAQLTLKGRGTRFFVNWASLVSLQRMTCLGAHLVNWPRTLNIKELKVTADQSFQRARWWNWPSLEVLNLEDVYLPKLPDEVGNLANLRTFRLANISGMTEISKNLSNCVKLTSVCIERCYSLEGDLALPSSVTSIHISSCKFSNTLLRDVVRQCPNLKTLQLFRIQINSTIPHELFALMQLQTLQLPMCGLQGNISANFAELTNLRSMDLSYNNLTGSLPQEVVDLPNLKILNVGNNNLLTGQLNVPPNLHLAASQTEIQRQ